MMYTRSTRFANRRLFMGLTEVDLQRLRQGLDIDVSLEQPLEAGDQLQLHYGTTDGDVTAYMMAQGWGVSSPAPDHAAEMRQRHGHILVCLVGLPFSGKSTWARQQGHPIVSPDAIRLAMHGQAFLGRAEPWVWTLARTMVRASFEAGHRIVILDATNVSQKRRAEWRDRDWEVYYQLIPTAATDCIARAQAAGRDNMVEVIQRMGLEWEDFTEGERLWPGWPVQEPRS